MRCYELCAKDKEDSSMVLIYVVTKFLTEKFLIFFTVIIM